MLEDRRISAKSIAEQLGISRERVGSIIHKDLDMRKLSAKWVPKCLNTDEKCQRFQSSEQLLEFFRLCATQMFFCRGWVTMNETWLYHCHLETRQSNSEWSGGIAARPAPPPKIRSSKIRWKSSHLPRFFGMNQDGILLIDYLPKGQTVNAEYYSSLLVQLKDILKEKRHGKVAKRVWSL